MGSHKKKKAPEAAAAAAAAPAAPQDAAPAAAPQQAPEPATLSALKAAEDKQKSLASQLRDVERQIYDLETRYLAGCNPNANALKGYEGLHSLVGSSKPATAPPAPEDRIFSSSSINFTPSA